MVIFDAYMETRQYMEAIDLIVTADNLSNAAKVKAIDELIKSWSDRIG